MGILSRIWIMSHWSKRSEFQKSRGGLTVDLPLVRWPPTFPAGMRLIRRLHRACGGSWAHGGRCPRCSSFFFFSLGSAGLPLHPLLFWDAVHLGKVTRPLARRLISIWCYVCEFPGDSFSPRVCPPGLHWALVVTSLPHQALCSQQTCLSVPQSDSWWFHDRLHGEAFSLSRFWKPPLSLTVRENCSDPMRYVIRGLNYRKRQGS